MSDPLVSIVIPCFNAERYVGEAIQSALEQKYPRKEVIVVDDGSSDKSLEVVKSFGSAVRWETGSHRGGATARNRGLELARGELIQFLDADDLLHPEKLERQVRLAVGDTNNIVYCDYDTRWEDGCGASMQSPGSDGSDSVVFVLKRSGLSTVAPLHWKRHLLSVQGFRTELVCSQERDLHLRLACKGLGFRHLPRVLCTIRRRKESVSGDYVRVLDQHSEIAWNAYKVLRRSGGLTDERCEALAGFLAKAARHYLQRGHSDRARDYLAQAERIHPSAGIRLVYSKYTRALLHITTPERVEWLASWKRHFL